MIVGAIALLAVVGVIAFMVGKSKGEDDIKSEYQPGQPKYNAIYTAGQKAGQATGESAGSGHRRGSRERPPASSRARRPGSKRASSRGRSPAPTTSSTPSRAAGTSAATTSSRSAQGSNGVDYTLASRKEMAEGQQYALCESDPSEICQFNSPVQQ